MCTSGCVRRRGAGALQCRECQRGPFFCRWLSLPRDALLTRPPECEPPPPVCSRRDEGGLAVCVRWGHAIATGCFCLVRKAVLPPSPWGTKPARTAHHLEGHSPPSKAESHRFFNSAKSADLGTSCGYEFLGFYLKTGEFQGSSEVPVSDRSQGRGGVYFWAGPGPGGDEGSPWVQNVKGDRETQDLR